MHDKRCYSKDAVEFFRKRNGHAWDDEVNITIIHLQALGGSLSMVSRSKSSSHVSSNSDVDGLPSGDAEVLLRTRRARIGNLNVRKESLLSFAHHRLTLEAPRVAARLWDLWQRDGRFPLQAGKFKVLNLPSAALGQGLWTQVAGQMQSWLSNAENQLDQAIRTFSDPRSKVPISKAQRRWEREAFQIHFVGPYPRRSPLRKKVRGRRDQERQHQRGHSATWENATTERVAQALRAFHAPSLSPRLEKALVVGNDESELSVNDDDDDVIPTEPSPMVLTWEQRGALLWEAKRRPSRRIEGLAVTPAEQLVRALWVQVLERCPQPFWRNMPWVVSPSMANVVMHDAPVALDIPGGMVDSAEDRNGSSISSKSIPLPQRKTKVQRSAKPGSRRARTFRPLATHHVVIKLPVRSEWPRRQDLMLDWHDAVQEVVVYDKTSPAAVLRTQERTKALQQWKADTVQAHDQGLPAPQKPKNVPLWSAQDQSLALCTVQAAGITREQAQTWLDAAKDDIASQTPAAHGRKKRAVLHEVALPLLAGSETLPGVLANSVILLPPREERGRSQWQARLVYRIQAVDLQPSAKLGFEARQQPQGVLALDAGVRTGLTTNLDTYRQLDFQAFQDLKKQHRSRWETSRLRGLALDDHGHPNVEGLALDFLLPNWGQRLAPLIQASWRTAAGRQSQGLAVSSPRYRGREQRLSGRIDHEMQTVLKRTVCALRPLFIVLEDLDLQGGKGELSRETNRRVQRMGFGVARKWLVDHASIYGYTVHFENPAFTSQRCWLCGHIDKNNRDGETFVCLKCHHHDHADRNAALNLQEGFLWDQRLRAMGVEERERVGLSNALIEGWMPPERVKQALLARQAFLEKG